MFKGQRVYFKGEEAEYTGRTETLYGSLWYEVRMLEGCDAGTVRVIATAPGASVSPAMRQGIQDWQEEQDAFRRLRKLEEDAA